MRLPYGISGLNKIKMEAEDITTLKNGQLNFIAFSYYHSTISKTGDSWFNIGGFT